MARTFLKTDNSATSASPPQIGTGIPRAIEATLALSALIVSAPILILSAVVILLTSRGPILFRQKRVGLHGELFVLFKLRTMRTGQSGIKVTAADDERVTGIGKILRKTKLDELPTLWNVLKGDMSLVGPRPEVVEYVDLGNLNWRSVLTTRPGLTDPVTLRLRNEELLLAQVRNCEQFYLQTLQPIKVSGYLDYLQQRSWQSDVMVLWQTVVAVISPSKAPIPTLEELTCERLETD